MASGNNTGWQKNVLCRYFVSGVCTAGSDCLFSHDENCASMAPRETQPCKFFLQGTCAYDKQCRFSHGEPLPQDEDDGGGGAYPPLVDSMEALALKDDKTKTRTTESDEQDSIVTTISAEEDSTPVLPTYQVLPKTSWINAPEFVPTEQQAAGGKKSWAEVTGAGSGESEVIISVKDAESQLCPYYMVGECRYGEHCVYIHGNFCEMCSNNILHPHHPQQNKKHEKDCLSKHEAQMELAFRHAKSKDKTCGICMEVVLDKSNGEARFGILPNCAHCFCLSCLRTWRQAKQFEHKIIRACPECRQTSDYICPSRYWVETPEEKEELLESYKVALNKKECKYFNKGQGECPFGNKCFYRHASSDGKDVDVGPPSRRTTRSNAEGDLSLVQRLLLYDFFEEREGRLMLPFEYLELIEILSDSENEEVVWGA